METSTLRNAIIEKLRNEKGFKNIVTANISGSYFSAADIALTDMDGKHEVYRIAVIKHRPQKKLCLRSIWIKKLMLTKNQE